MKEYLTRYLGIESSLILVGRTNAEYRKDLICVVDSERIEDYGRSRGYDGENEHYTVLSRAHMSLDWYHADGYRLGRIFAATSPSEESVSVQRDLRINVLHTTVTEPETRVWDTEHIEYTRCLVAVEFATRVDIPKLPIESADFKIIQNN